MKTLFVNLKSIAMMMVAVSAMGLTACDNDDTVETPVKEEIVGTWAITSYKVAGDEYMDLAFEEAYLTFNAYTGEKGVFEQEVTFPDEESTSITGDYSVDNATHKVEMNYEGDIVIAEVEFSNNGDNLRWDGTQDGYPLVILAIRK